MHATCTDLEIKDVTRVEGEASGKDCEIADLQLVLNQKCANNTTIFRHYILDNVVTFNTFLLNADCRRP